MQIVRKNTVQITCSSLGTANQLKQDMPDFMKHKFYPVLQDILENQDTSAETWQIEQLPIFIEIDDLDQWKNQFLNKASRQIRTFIRQEKPQNVTLKKQPKPYISKKGQNPNLNRLELLVQYLKTGILIKNPEDLSLQEMFKFHHLDS